ncbi:MAG: 23S rRNA (adenine(1618)-N(6))-methyltransferase RlmF [Bacteroidetes bacterium]|nr:23S rRNA (adenine(1618)-N(6))-methyltransferase RlmF [Bacteroidota bacterium]
MKSKEKGVGLHPRNIHQGRYDLAALVQTLPELSQIIFENNYGQQSLDFANPIAVKLLNKALLLHYYELIYWDIPEGYLCPPIPGRADYLHHVADLLARENGKRIPLGEGTQILDVGVGANLIYPILGTSLFGWNFVGTEIDFQALSYAASLITSNPRMEGKVSLRYQADAQRIFDLVIEEGDFFEACLCNPPFHESAEVALEGSKRKIKNLKGQAPVNPVLNFGGQPTELWTIGGELGFIGRMIQESVTVQTQVGWFTVLVSKATHLSFFQGQLENVGVKSQRVIEMGQGNKRGRILAWSFFR